MSALTVDDVAALWGELRATGCSPRTAAGALATLHSIVRYARRHGWIAVDPVEQLEADERPRPQRRRQRVLGREEIERLLPASAKDAAAFPPMQEWDRGRSRETARLLAVEYGRLKRATEALATRRKRKRGSTRGNAAIARAGSPYLVRAVA